MRRVRWAAALAALPVTVAAVALAAGTGPAHAAAPGTPPPTPPIVVLPTTAPPPIGPDLIPPILETAPPPTAAPTATPDPPTAPATPTAPGAPPAPTASPAPTPTAPDPPAGEAPAEPTADPSVDPPGSTDGDKPPTGIDGSVFGVDPTCPHGSDGDEDNLDCIPIDRYDIWYDGGHAWSATTKVTGTFTQWFFGMSRWLVRAGIWLVAYTLEFHLADDLAAPAERTAHAYESHILLRFGIPGLCLFASQWWAAIQLARGRVSRGLAEAATSLVISTLAAGALATPSTTILGENGLLGTTRDLALCVAAASAGGCHPDQPLDPDTLTRPLAQKLKHAFVVQPHMILNTGRVLDDPAAPSACLDAYRRAVAAGPWDTKGEPRTDYLRPAGGECDELADWNEKMTAERLVGAVLVLVAAFFVFLLLLLVGGGLAVAELALVALVCLTFFALAFGQAPGPGRAVLFRWAAGILKALFMVLLAVFFLSLYLLLLQGLLASTDGRPLIVRLGMLDLLVAVSFLFYRRARRASDRLADQVGRRLERTQPGAHSPTASWLRPASAAGGPGFHPAALWNEGRGELRGATRPLDLAQAALYWRGARRTRRPGLLRHAGHPAPGPARGGAAGGRGAGGAGASAAARLRARLAATRPAQAARLGWRAGRTATAYTLGAPVTYPRELPRAAAAVRRTRTQAIRTARRRWHATGAYARTYRDNLAAARRAAATPWHHLNRVRTSRRSPPP